MILPERQKQCEPGIRLVGAFPNAVLLCLLLLRWRCLSTRRALRLPLVYDDPAYFTSNPQRSQRPDDADVAWAFATGRTGELASADLAFLDAGCGNCSVVGPPAPHFTNLLFHLANTGLLFLLLRCLTAATLAERVRGGACLPCTIARGSVAWVSERKRRLEHLLRTAGVVVLHRLRTASDG